MRSDLRNSCLRVLLRKRDDLILGLSSRDEIKIEGRAPDHLDEALASSARTVAVDAVNRQMELLTLVKKALNKLSQGTEEFGECEICDEPIAEARMAAVPWTDKCIYCQEEAESLKKGNKL